MAWLARLSVHDIVQYCNSTPQLTTNGDEPLPVISTSELVLDSGVTACTFCTLSHHPQSSSRHEHNSLFTSKQEHDLRQHYIQTDANINFGYMYWTVTPRCMLQKIHEKMKEKKEQKVAAAIPKSGSSFEACLFSYVFAKLTTNERKLSRAGGTVDKQW